MSRRDKGSLPTGFDPAAHPILSRHWFGAEPILQVGKIAAEIVASPRRQRATEHLHNLGPRPVLEALVEVQAGADLDRVLADYARLDMEVVIALGGDKFPPNIFAVGST